MVLVVRLAKWGSAYPISSFKHHKGAIVHIYRYAVSAHYSSNEPSARAFKVVGSLINRHAGPSRFTICRVCRV